MAKLVLIAAPTFKAKVPIPLAGGTPVEVEFIFKHKTKTALDEWIKTRAEKGDEESVLDMASGWELSDEFNAESIKLLLENYIGSALAIYKTYVEELLGAARIKN